MTIEDINKRLEKNLSIKRYKHSVNVMNCAIQLAEKYSEDTDEAALAGLIHDCARDIRGENAFLLCEKYGLVIDEVSCIQPELLHGRLGAKLACDEYAVTSARVLEAIVNHTTGSPGMDKLSKIIFLADYIEPGRIFPGVEDIRKEAFKNLDRAVLLGLDSTIRHVVENGRLLHPDTICTRNWLLLNMRAL